MAIALLFVTMDATESIKTQKRRKQMGMDSTKRKGPKQFEASKNELHAIFRKRPFSLEKAQRVLSDFQ
ncbi:hypothetical protein, partial [uncultured Dubosiella sp.]|uniref:hypothetical protein n=1 Tax=uncultured Dubosiella sp. TaxID=1937011 RepID=UPI0025B4E0B8